jgi:hypothetical protein
LISQSRGLGDVYKRQELISTEKSASAWIRQVSRVLES